jgi:hypothetical protein
MKMTRQFLLSVVMDVAFLALIALVMTRQSTDPQAVPLPSNTPQSKC